MPDHSDLNIYQIGTNPVVAFAARELKKYMRLMTGAGAEVTILAAYTPQEKDGILGWSDLGDGKPARRSSRFGFG